MRDGIAHLNPKCDTERASRSRDLCSLRCCSSVRSAPTRQTGAQLQDGRPHVHPIDGIVADGDRDVAGERASSSSPPCCVSSRTHHAFPCACRLPQLYSQRSACPILIMDHPCDGLSQLGYRADVAKLPRRIVANVGALRR